MAHRLLQLSPGRRRTCQAFQLRGRLSERAERFREEFERLENPKEAWGIRLTATPVGDEIRIDRVFRQSGLAEEFDKPWRKVVYRKGNNKRQLAGLQSIDMLPNYWQPRLRAARAERDVTPSNNLLYDSYRELHCDGLIELGFVSGLSYPLLPDLSVDMSANLAVWADHGVPLRALQQRITRHVDVDDAVGLTQGGIVFDAQKILESRQVRSLAHERLDQRPDRHRNREACAAQLGLRSRIRRLRRLVFEGCFGCVKTHLDDAKVSSSKETATHRWMPITPRTAIL